MRAYVTAADGSWSGRDVGHLVVRSLKFEGCGAPTARVHVVKGHVARTAQAARPITWGIRRYGSEIIYLLRLRPKVRRIRQ